MAVSKRDLLYENTFYSPEEMAVIKRDLLYENTFYSARGDGG
jgi:hypothetical protein